MMESLGSADYEFVDGLLAQIGLNCRVDLGTDEYERQLNFMLSVIRSIKPRDEIEAMIASQMAQLKNRALSPIERVAVVSEMSLARVLVLFFDP